MLPEYLTGLLRVAVLTSTPQHQAMLCIWCAVAETGYPVDTVTEAFPVFRSGVHVPYGALLCRDLVRDSTPQRQFGY
jgi:hypothetical protein